MSANGSRKIPFGEKRKIRLIQLPPEMRDCVRLVALPVSEVTCGEFSITNHEQIFGVR